MGFPGGSDSKESACSGGDWDLILGSGRSSGEGNGYPLQYSCLKNSMDGEELGVTEQLTMTNDVEHLLMCLFAICVSYLMIIKIFHHLKNKAVYFLSSIF